MELFYASKSESRPGFNHVVLPLDWFSGVFLLEWRVVWVFPELFWIKIVITFIAADLSPCLECEEDVVGFEDHFRIDVSIICSQLLGREISQVEFARHDCSG